MKKEVDTIKLLVKAQYTDDEIETHILSQFLALSEMNLANLSQKDLAKCEVNGGHVISYTIGKASEPAALISVLIKNMDTPPNQFLH